MTSLLASLPMTEPAHLPDARETTQHTYDRRRARAAADTLATISPARWDDETRSIIATLATMTAPSRITDLLDRELPWDMPSPHAVSVGHFGPCQPGCMHDNGDYRASH